MLLVNKKTINSFYPLSSFMKGVILAGGKGTRLYPTSRILSKNLLPIYDKPMILYAINSLRKSDIKDILLVLGKEHPQQFIELLGDGSEFGVKISYVIQEKAGGVAHALSLAENFCSGECVCVILADNVLEKKIDVEDFTTGARIFLKEVPDPKRFGVAIVNDGKVIEVEEKPAEPKSNLAIVGVYLFDNKIFDIIRTLKPSNRGELEIPDAMKSYLEAKTLEYRMIDGFWCDAGTHNSLLKTSNYVKDNIEKFN